MWLITFVRTSVQHAHTLHYGGPEGPFHTIIFRSWILLLFNLVLLQTCIFFNLAFLQTCSLPTMHSYKPLFLITQLRFSKKKIIAGRCACIVQTYGGPKARRAVHLVTFQSFINFCKVGFFNFALLQSCIFSILHFWKHAVCQTKYKSRWKLWCVCHEIPCKATHTSWL